jgi:predicted XRE-type DNA-binding protein
VGHDVLVAHPDPADDAVLVALDHLVAAARANIVAWVGIMERVEKIREQRRLGLAYTQMSVTADSPPIIDVVASNQERLTVAAAHFRRALAHQLADEGWSTAEIARTFGVTRQRVSALLKPGDGGTAVAGEAMAELRESPL